jgi:hypothetical protein
MLLCPEVLPSLDVARLPAEVAAFLLALQHFPLDEARALRGSKPREGAFEALREELMPTHLAALRPQECRTRAVWWDALLAETEMTC